MASAGLKLPPGATLVDAGMKLPPGATLVGSSQVPGYNVQANAELLRQGKPPQVIQAPTKPPEGFGGAVMNDLSAIPGALANTVSSVGKFAMDPDSVRPALNQYISDTKLANEQRKNAGYSTPYRALAPVAQALGANVPAMEQAAKAGDVGAVAGHAAVPVALTLGAEGLRAAADAVPSFNRAGGHFSAIESQYGNRIVQPTKSLPAAMDLFDRINTTKAVPVPTPVQELLERYTTNQPLSFTEARNFYTDLNSLLYDRELMGKFPQFRAPIQRMTNLLDQDVVASLPTQTARNWYTATQAEWRRANKIQNVADTAGGIVGGAAGAAIGHEIGGGLAAPTIGGYAGYAAGKPVIGSMVRSVLERPKLPSAPPGSVSAGVSAVTRPSPLTQQRIMDMAKNGEISPGEADRRIRLLGGTTRIARPQAPPR